MQFLIWQCNVAFEEHQNILIALFLAGLVGGLTHCSGMCGPFVVSQIKDGNKSSTTFQKFNNAAIIPYHLGRMTTYVILGIIAAYLSKQIIGNVIQHWVSIVFLSLAGVIFIVSAMPQIKQKFTAYRRIEFSAIGKLISKIAKPLFSKPIGFNRYLLGTLLGFLPCGLIFAALMVVSTTRDPFTAALGMTIFTLGTFPSLFLVGLGGQIAYRNWPNFTRITAKSVMVFNGFSLFFLAGNMILD